MALSRRFAEGAVTRRALFGGRRRIQSLGASAAGSLSPVADEKHRTSQFSLTIMVSHVKWFSLKLKELLFTLVF